MSMLTDKTIHIACFFLIFWNLLLIIFNFMRENDVTGRMVYRMFFLGRNFVFGLFCTLKPLKELKKLKLKNLKTLKS